MYTIYQMPDGTYSCEGRLQDGTERWTKPTLEEAIKSMKGFARTMNNTKLKKRQITYLRPVQVVKQEYEPFNPFG